MVNRVPIPQFTVPVLDRTWVLLPRYLEKCILPGVLFFFEYPYNQSRGILACNLPFLIESALTLDAPSVHACVH